MNISCYFFISAVFIMPHYLYASKTLEQAIELKKAGKPYASLALLKNIKSVNPLRLKLEKAENLLLVGQYKKARLLFLEVLDNPKLPAMVRKNTEHFLALLNKEESKVLTKKHQISGSLKLTYGTDSNATRGPDRDIVDDTISPIPLKNNNERDDNYYIFTAKFNSLYHFSNSLNIGGKPVYISLKNNFKLLDIDYSEVNDVDFRFITLKSKLIFKQPKNWGLSFGFSHNLINRNTESYANVNGFQINFQKHFDLFNISLIGSKTRRHYFERPDDSDVSGFHKQKTGWRRSLKIIISSSPFKEMITELRFTGIKQKAQWDNFAYDAYFTSLRNNWKVKKNMYLYANFYHYKYDYKEVEIGFNSNGSSREIYDTPRHDQIFNFKIGTRYFINSNVFAEFQANIAKSKANHQLHEYKQQSFEFTIGVKF